MKKGIVCSIGFIIAHLIGFAQVNLTSGLSACYALDGNSNEPINSLTGTLSAITPTVDRFNNTNSALRFSGTTSSKILLPSSNLLKPSTDISMSLWVKPENLSDMEIIFTKNTSSLYFSSYALTFQNNGSGYKFRGYRQDGSGSNYIDAVTTVTAANEWYHVVLTIDNSNMKIYVNGALESTVPCLITSYNYQSGKEVVLGGTNETAADFPFKGCMDNVRFYNRVINAAEVNELYAHDAVCQEVTGISNHVVGNDQIFIYPNPFRDHIQLSVEEKDNLKYTIQNSIGQIIKKGILRSGKSFIDLSEQPAGIYLLRASDDSKQSVYKLIKE